MSDGDLDADFFETQEENSAYGLTASGIAEYIRFNCCPRFFKLKFEGKEVRKRTWKEAFKPISPLLYGTGKALEEKKVEELKAKAAEYVDFTIYDPTKYHKGWEKAEDSMNNLHYIISHQLSEGEKTDQRPILLYQVPMRGHIGVWAVKGISDLIAVYPLKDGKVRVRIFELKSSWKEQTAHRIQVAIYVLLLQKDLGNLASKVEVEGGVINRETSLESLQPDKMPKFKLSPLIQDVQRLLAKNGELNRIHQTDIDDVEYQLSWRCDNCGFNECCIVCSVEKEAISLLNLSRGEQKALGHHGIRYLEDLAKLKAVVDASNLRPYDFKILPAKDSTKVNELSADPVIGGKLDWMVERAQYMLGGIRPGSQYASRSRWMPWLTGTGYGSLPEDSPGAGIDSALTYNPNGLIRIYLFIEWDYMLDVVSLLSAKVSCTRYRGEPVLVSHVIGSLPDDRVQCINEEEKLLTGFFKDLSTAIAKVANQVGSPQEAPIHLYFFSRQERDMLMKAVTRQPNVLAARAVRDLLGLRQAIDQPMFSILQDEVAHRKALRFHSTGLLPILEQACFFDRGQWRVRRKDGSTVDLALVFRDGLFNYSLPFRRGPDGKISFLHEGANDGYYPARARFGDQLPIEYIWGVKGRLDNFEQVKGPAKILLDKRKWCDYNTKSRRITDEELNLMGTKICMALEQIERSLNIRNRRLGKKPITVPKISEFTLGDSTLERSCREFLDLEYFSKRQEMYQHYAMLPYQRVASGRSVIFQCTQVEEFESPPEFIVRGKLVYEGMGLPREDCTANACRVKGSDGSSSGDWMVVTEVCRNSQGQFEETEKRSPSEVEKSARAIVDRVDIAKLEIRIKVVSWPRGKGSKYSAWHNLPTTDPEKALSKYMQLFEAGRYYILDELADDIVSDRAAKSLDYAANNVLYGLLADYLSGKTCGQNRNPIPKEAAAGFLSWVEGRKLRPKAEQKRLVDSVFSKEPIIMLQGPPGTGKTETLQLAVLAHIAAHSAKSRCRVLMVAPTHKAIQEFVTKLARCHQEYTTQGGKDLRDLQIYRVLSSNTSTEIRGVKNVNYNEDEAAVLALSDALVNQSTLTQLSASTSAPLVLCVTPPGLYGLMKKIGDKEPPWGEGFFDLLVVDEASMMRLPELILSGSFLSKNSQIIVAGDHRQLPPIVAHNWEKEDRRTLEEMASFLSAMDFLRLLRNEELGLERIKCRNPAAIPAVRLCESHRCHSVVAEFLREWVYEKDQIEFRSDQKDVLLPVAAATSGLQVVLEPDNVFALIVHDEAESFQSNVVEAQIVAALVKNASAESVGIVTPHNAQKGLLRNVIGDVANKVRVDTVERYQGGEADCIVISSCVSDPDYVRSESDFLLNLNRINVAVSRMKKKLVIVASRSIFEFMPQDARDYDKALLWRGICETVGYTADSTPKWAGSLADFTGDAASQVKVDIYVKTAK